MSHRQAPSVATSPSVLDEMSGRLRTIMGMAALGLSTKEIARRLDSTEAAIRQLAVTTTHLIRSDLLRDIRTIRSDKSLGTADRALVAGGAFRITCSPPALPVIVVDDVVTSGATMREAIATLLHAGVHVVGGVALAATPRS